MLNHTLVRRLVYAAIVVTIFLIPFCNALPARASPALVIGEVAWAGSSASLADEWLEIWNIGDQPISLDSLSLVGASDKPIFFPPDAVLTPQSVYLIANYADSDPKSVLDIAPHMVTSSLSLSNSALLIRLVDVNGDEIDRAGTGGTPPAGSSSDKLSMIRQGDTWISATSSPGTPGFCDGCLTIPITNQSYDTPLPSPPIDESPAPSDTTDAASPTSTLETVLDSTPTPSSTPYAQNIQIIPDESPVTSTPETLTFIESTSTGMATSSQATTTPSVIPPEAATSTSIQDADILADATSTAQATYASSTEADTDAVIIEVETEPRYDLVRLNEIMPHPENGLEWIELTTLDNSLAIQLKGFSLHDALGKILELENGLLNASTSFGLITLPSSRLNNDGDSLFLRSPDGSLIDSFAYVSSQKSVSWARLPDGLGEWRLTALPTPSQPNSLAPLPGSLGNAGATQEPPKQTEELGSSSTNATPSQPSIVENPSQKDKPVQKTPSVSPKSLSTTKPAVNTLANPKKEVAKATSTAAVKKIDGNPKNKTAKSSIKKAPVKKRPLPITLNDLDMSTLETYRGLYVRLRGEVASPGGLLTNHGFIILAPDGRGLMVRVPKKIKLPTLGSPVEVTGLLEFSSQDIPSLKVSAATDITLASSSDEGLPKSRLVDLLAPDDEDLWSLVSVTGTVISIKGIHVRLATSEAELDMTIRPVIKYRIERLMKGDAVAVTGVLNTSKDTPTILPRQADDIQIVAHAAPEKTSELTRAWPNWMPFGAAGMAVAANEGAKFLRERRKRQKLEQKLQEPIAAA